MGLGGISNPGARSAGNHETDNRGVTSTRGFWTDRRIEWLLKLWAEGHSTTEIGAHMGCTRNAVIGKLHRLKAPEPADKLPVLRNRVYTRQMPEEARIKAAIRDKRRRLKNAADQKRQVRTQFRAQGASVYSAAYRKHMPRVPEMTKGELRAMLQQAVQNTAAMA